MSEWERDQDVIDRLLYEVLGPAEDDPTIPCPHCTHECKRPVFSDAIVCPACEWLFYFAEQSDGSIVAWKTHQTQPKEKA